jgi:hypothetical protein
VQNLSTYASWPLLSPPPRVVPKVVCPRAASVVAIVTCVIGVSNKLVQTRSGSSTKTSVPVALQSSASEHGRVVDRPLQPIYPLILDCHDSAEMRFCRKIRFQQENENDIQAAA